MSTEDLVERLLAQADLEARKRCLEEQSGGLTAEAGQTLADALKKKADEYFRSDVRLAFETAELLVHLGRLMGNPLHTAQGLLAEANTRCMGGLGEFERAIQLYDEAAAIYQAQGRPDEAARSQVGKVWALSNLGRNREAIDTGMWASGILEEYGRWQPLAHLIVNVAILQSRLGEETEALALLDRAVVIYRQIDQELPWVPLVEQSRATMLRNLGRYDEAIRASQFAQEKLAKLGQTAEAARAQQSLALAYYLLGRYNEALALFDEVRQVFMSDGRHRDAILVDLFATDCLLELRRFADVLAICRRVRRQFSELGTLFEVAQALVNEAVAHAGINQHAEALTSLDEARAIFRELGNDVLVASTDLERAAILLRRGQPGEAYETASAAAAVFARHSMPVRQAQAHLLEAQATAALDGWEAAQQLAGRVLQVAHRQDIPSLSYQAHFLLGSLALSGGNPHKAAAEYDLAVRELERLRGHMMVEHRVDFLQDKATVYEELVRIHLDAGRPARALECAERGKSRALLDLLAFRLDLSLTPREGSDRPLVDELMALRARRDRVYRRRQGPEEAHEEGKDASGEVRREARREMLALEKQITNLWHRLLVRNADYARDAALWQVRAEPVQPHLPPETLLIEYFIARGGLVAFLVSPDHVEARSLEAELGEVRRLLQLFWLNVRSVPGSDPEQVRLLASNAQGLLQGLHALLVAPLEPELARWKRLIVVPHGPLHYLPFSALSNADGPLLDRHTVSTLPGASLLRFCADATPAAGDALVLGHSWEGRLPHAVHEARSVARILGTEAWLEGEATVERLRAEGPRCRTLHLVAHGEFRADNPLFSGLALADGWLATLDLFNLRLDASLVTLSACETGRNVVGGGDELLGLMRALLYAGASSVVLSLWTVEDRSAARLMETFYTELGAGRSKGEALQLAQQALQADRAYAHPYFWAPFCLVGEPGRVCPQQAKEEIS